MLRSDARSQYTLEVFYSTSLIERNPLQVQEEAEEDDADEEKNPMEVEVVDLPRQDLIHEASELDLH